MIIVGGAPVEFVAVAEIQSRVRVARDHFFAVNTNSASRSSDARQTGRPWDGKKGEGNERIIVGARNVLSCTRRLMQNVPTFRDKSYYPITTLAYWLPGQMANNSAWG